MLISQQDAEIEENNIFNKILRCVLYFNTKGTATIKPLIALGEPLYLYTPLVRSISYRYQSWYTTVLSEKWPESKPERDTLSCTVGNLTWTESCEIKNPSVIYQLVTGLWNGECLLYCAGNILGTLELLRIISWFWDLRYKLWIYPYWFQVTLMVSWPHDC